MKCTDVLIIGAGISGLLCASELKRAGRSVRVLDKGRGCGGRMATRRIGAARLDHGAQFFTVRDPRFQRYVDEWLDAGVVREWFSRAPYDSGAVGHPRYCGSAGMTDVPNYLARDLEVHRSQTVVQVLRDKQQWVARSASGSEFRAHHLVVTAPLPQALALLETSGLDYAGSALTQLRAVRYERGLATLAILDGPSGLPDAGFVKLQDPRLSWIADNQAKGISPAVPCVSIHATAAFAAQHWDSPDAVRGRLMLDAATEHLAANVVESTCHRWGYTLPMNPYPEVYFHNPDLKLSIAGDAFGGERVEGAALSGLAAGGALVKRFDIV
jgi:renalase